MWTAVSLIDAEVVAAELKTFDPDKYGFGPGKPVMKLSTKTNIIFYRVVEKIWTKNSK